MTDSLPRINKTLRTRARSTTFLSLSLPFDSLPRTVKHGITFQRLFSYPRRGTVYTFVERWQNRCRYFGGFPHSATRVCRFDSRSRAAPIGWPSASIIIDRRARDNVTRQPSKWCETMASTATAIFRECTRRLYYRERRIPWRWSRGRWTRTTPRTTPRKGTRGKRVWERKIIDGRRVVVHECSERREEVEREERPTRRRSRGIDSWPWKAGEAVEIEREKERERAFSLRSLPLLPALVSPLSLSLPPSLSLFFVNLVLRGQRTSHNPRAASVI